MNFKKTFNLFAIAALATIGATGCGGGGTSHGPSWSHSGRTGFYVVVTSCSSYSSSACYCDSFGCWYDNSGWYDFGGGYYTGYWPTYSSYDPYWPSTSYYGNSSNSGYYSGSTSYYGNSSGYSADGQTKDTDLQNAELQKKELNDRAQTLATQHQMNFDAALQLTQLADKFNKLSVSGKLTDDDRAAIIDKTLGVAGITTDDVKKAMEAGVNGNKNALDDLLEKGAKNIGMPNSAGLRDQILPSLGMKI